MASTYEIQRAFKWDASNEGAITSVYSSVQEPVDLYLYQVAATPSVTIDAEIDDKVIAINSNAGIINGYKITFFEGHRFFQSDVVSSTATTVTISTPIDFAYTTDATVKVGNQNMNINGSSSIECFHVSPPPGVDFEIHTINISFVDKTAMDVTRFGGLGALTNGAVFRISNGIVKNLGNVKTNLDIAEMGFDLYFEEKVPTGTYGLRCLRDITEKNGTVIRLEGATSDQFQFLVQDNLAGLDKLNITINGHTIAPIVED